MNARNWIRTMLCGSLSLNLVLTGLLIFRGPISKQVAPVHLPAELGSNGEMEQRVERQTDSGLLVESTWPDWASIRSDDWQLYQKQLREMGCPEGTLQAILVAEVQHWFEAEWKKQPKETNFWVSSTARAANRRKVRKLRREFELEERAFLEGLLGVPWHNLQAYVGSMEGEAWGNMLLGFLGDDRFHAGNGLFVKFADFYEQLQEREPRWMTTEEIQRAQDEVRRHVAEFRALLTPSEFEEFELRLMTVEVLDVWGVEEQFGAELSGAEFREVLRIRRGDTSVFEKAFFRELMEETGLALPGIVDPAESVRQEAALRSLLGDARYEGYVRAQDPEYRFLSRTLRGLGMPTESVWAVYDIRGAAREMAERVRTDQSIGRQQKQAMLDNIRTETQNALRGSLGAVAYEAYVRDQGDWLNALATGAP